MDNTNNEPNWVAGKSTGDAQPGNLLPDISPEPSAPIRPSGPPDGSGRQMADGLREKGYHPVIIFGTTASGKSTLLSSLIGYFVREPAASISLADEWIVPLNSEYEHYQYEEAKRFYNHGVLSILSGKTHVKTMTEYPFFIPVIVKPNNGLPAIKLAFLESKGEWYTPKPDSPEYYQPLKQEISDVLSHFPGGISVLHIAPYNSDGDAQGKEDADLGLRGAIKAYERERVSPYKDNHLMLFAKWDLFATPHAADKKFSNPDPQEIQSLLNQRFNKSWTAYQSMDIGEPTGRRSYMQYCAGLIKNDRTVIHLDKVLEPLIDRYPRTVWNWLYRNATVDEKVPSQILFHDVMPLPPRKLTVLDRVMRVVGIQ